MGSFQSVTGTEWWPSHPWRRSRWCGGGRRLEPQIQRCHWESQLDTDIVLELHSRGCQRASKADCVICSIYLNIFLSTTGSWWHVSYLFHCIVGIVSVAVPGEGVEDFRPGDHVIPCCHAACGRCSACRRGDGGPITGVPWVDGFRSFFSPQFYCWKPILLKKLGSESCGNQNWKAVLLSSLFAMLAQRKAVALRNHWKVRTSGATILGDPNVQDTNFCESIQRFTSAFALDWSFPHVASGCFWNNAGTVETL